ncbi:hypothetical protein M427DRAFT_54372 [Gonapodya prolifera JEL478]|uniref:Carbohydrate esterase family 16 protein n=1 Tax=Gonapodya prolifera (strain JEL478) TaxID=1344416 RepID=A0A139AMN4_GONPJ|nr:hypothetical protein M427DRAFT_54372 [Gonapodya prolifera JEL478]|eukprot:KXS17783.1 hypothetical protein M427DRAFT_54372 [Gonapodya prolifera JEL478]
MERSSHTVSRLLTAALLASCLALVNAASQLDISQCPSLKPRTTKPTSVHDLRIDDFKVIAALGDSITAAFSAKQSNPIAVTLENRGISYAIGGDSKYLTLPNLISRYNTDLTGPSIGDHLVELCFGPLCPPYQYRPLLDKFNAAQSGALISNIAHELNDYLLPVMKLTPGIDWDNDWKIITIFIMSNDLCLSCDITGPINTFFLSPSDFSAELLDVLTTIRANIPRVLVNVVQGLHVSGVWDLTKNDPNCIIKRSLGLAIECTCAFPLGDSAAGKALRAQTDAQADAYNAEIAKLRESFLPGGSNYDAKYNNTFAMVVEPALSGLDIPQFPSNMLSALDCFHPSDRAHGMFASYMWNNLHKPYADKLRKPGKVTTTWKTPGFSTPKYGLSEIPLFCPTDDSRIPTN